MLKKNVLKEIDSAVSNGICAFLELTSDEKTYFRKFAPKERLILLGGGHVSLALCSFAVLLGFLPTVVDDRPMFANSRRFPAAEKIICDSFRKAIQELKVNENDYVCILTRGHRWDADCLRELLAGVFPFYLGMMGSRRRVHELYQMLEEEGIDRRFFERIHSPIGIEINALTPEEIALSVCSELIKEKRSNDRKEKKECLEIDETEPELIRHMIQTEEPLALAVVLETLGSTPAKTGAMMVIDPLGFTKGTIGGGCGEAEVINKARNGFQKREQLLMNIDLTAEVSEEEGMVCGGKMKVLVDYIE